MGENFRYFDRIESFLRNVNAFLALIPGSVSTFENRDPGFLIKSHLCGGRFFEKKTHFTSK